MCRTPPPKKGSVAPSMASEPDEASAQARTTAKLTCPSSMEERGLLMPTTGRPAAAARAHATMLREAIGFQKPPRSHKRRRPRGSDSTKPDFRFSLQNLRSKETIHHVNRNYIN